ncbi:MAG: hypothetical protein M1836_001026 [Candelina mexicana]|nr:MAG: hypothetical protein M1836_001026 [Candelina mexicana]
MEPQFAFASRDDLWRLHTEVRNVQTVQLDHSERLLRLEKRQDDDAKMKSVWGNSSPFPGVLSGTPQQDPIRNPAAEAFSNFDQDQQHNILGSLHLDTEDEPRRGASRANSVRFDESAIHGHLAQGSRSSSDFFTTRSGSGLGGHSMMERSSSHKSEGRQSSAAQSIHSAHSAASARANSLRIDTGYLLGPASNSPVEPLGPAPGLFFLGSVPSIIRCWMNTKFSHDSLLYAVICTGSYKSFLDSRLIDRLGLADLVTQAADGESTIKLPVYLPEAVVQQPSSRSSSPAPQLPTLNLDFSVVSAGQQSTEDKGIQIYFGSDVLRSHNADILFSQNIMTLFDDQRNKLSIPLVRPEDDTLFKTLRTLDSVTEKRRATTSPYLPAQSRDAGSDSKRGSPFSNGSRKALNASAPVFSSPTINPTENSMVGSGLKSVVSQENEDAAEQASAVAEAAMSESLNDSDIDSSQPLEGPSGNQSQQTSGPNNDTESSPLSATSARRSFNGGIRGPWRRDAGQGSRVETGNISANTGTAYQPAARTSRMKVLKPAKSSISPSAKSFPAPQPPVGFEATPSRNYEENRRKSQSAGTELNPPRQRESRKSLSGADIKSSPFTKVFQPTTNKARTSNPIGGASAFPWLSSASQKQSTPTAE